MKRLKSVKFLRGIRVGTVIECIICFLASRIPFMSMNPMAAALFVLAYMRERTGRLLCMAVYIGILSLGRVQHTVKYTLIFLSLMVTDRLIIRNGKNKSNQLLIVVAGMITTGIGIAGGIFDLKEALIYSVLEGVLVIVAANVINPGLTVLDYSKGSPQLSDEQTVSLTVLLLTAAGGLPDMLPAPVPFSEIGSYVFILYMAYRYGAFAGAAAGAGAGIAIGIREGNAAISGICCVAGIVLGLICDVFKRKDDDDEDELFIEENYMAQTGKKLQGFSEAFIRLGKMYSKNCEQKPVLNEVNTGEIFEDVTCNICRQCSNCSYCWEQKYYDTCHQALNIFERAGMEGVIRKEDIPLDFAKQCIRLKEFMTETGRQIELSRINTSWENRLAVNRSLIARQMIETGKLISELEQEISVENRINIERETELKAALGALGIKVKRIAIVEKKNSRVEICMNIKTSKRICITFKEVSDVIGNVIGDRWRTEEEYGSVIQKEYKNIIFIRDERYTVLTGMARIPKNGEECSGDNYSFIRMSNGKLIMMITDGAGSGRRAYDESETVIEMIEELTQAGFREDIALSLVNSTLLYSRKNDNFSTVDFCVIDLNDGMCEFIKYGAAPTFIKKHDTVKIIRNNSVPIGLIPETEPECVSYRLHDSDRIIMMSDGVADCFPGSNKEEYIRDMLYAADTSNPNELAEEILNCARSFNMSIAEDDMSVLVAGIWDKY